MQSSRSKTSYAVWTLTVIAIGVLITAGISQTVEFAYQKIGSPGQQFFANLKHAKVNLAFLKKDNELPSIVAQSNSYENEKNNSIEVSDKDSVADSAAFALPADADTIRFGWVGDNTPININKNPILQPYRHVENLLRLPDIMMGNLEGVITESTNSKCNKDSTNCFTFKGDYEFAKILRNAGFDLMNLANNHSFDFGVESFKDTQNALTAAGLQSTGELGEITIVKNEKGNVAIIGFSPNKGTNQIMDEVKMTELIKKAKTQANIVVVLAHAGAEGISAIHTRNENEFYAGESRGNAIKEAHTAIDAGADLFLASGPHVVRGMEFYNGKLIAYSLGNFMSHEGLSTKGLLSISGTLFVDLSTDGIFERATLVPMYLDTNGFPTIDPVNTAFPLMNKLSKEDFGDNAAIIDSEGIIHPFN